MKNIFFTSRRVGSALLMTTVVVAAATTIILVGAKELINSARHSTVTDQAVLADNMARAALQEGQLLYNKSQLPASNAGEYGVRTVTANNYTLFPYRRGFVSGTNCTQPSSTYDARSATIDPDCPYYDLSVRSIVSYTTNANGFALTTRELPPAVEVLIPLPVNPGITFTVNTALGVTYQYRTCTDVACTTPSALTPATPSSLPTFSVVNTVRAVKLLMTYTLVDGYRWCLPCGGR
jgi:hypothetical protein